MLKMLVSLTLAAMGLCCTVVQAQSNLKDTVTAQIVVQDEAGRPIPYVTVWAFEDLSPGHTAFPGEHLGAADLWRVTERYGALHEEISDDSASKPLSGIHVAPMGDRAGIVLEEMNYTESTGRRKNYARPDIWHFGFTFMKRGYFPGMVEFNVPKSQTSAQATVTLKRNPAEPIETAPYIETFERVRYQLSRFNDVAITQENQAIAKGFGNDLEAAAQQAIAVGDKTAAARIYARMRLMPKIIHESDGTVNIAGFLEGEAGSPEAKRAMRMAFELDPHNLYVWMDRACFGDQSFTPAKETLNQWQRRCIVQLEQIIAQHGESVWPDVYARRAGLYGALGDYARARELYLQGAEMEPRYDWNGYLVSMKDTMKFEKVPIPDGW